MTLNKKFRSVKTLIDVNRESPIMNEHRAAARGSRAGCQLLSNAPK